MSYPPGSPSAMPPSGSQWPTDPWGRPWPVDQYGRWWPADAYGRPVSPMGPPPGYPDQGPALQPGAPGPPQYQPEYQQQHQAQYQPASLADPSLYRGAPATLAAAVARQADGGPAVKLTPRGRWDTLIAFGEVAGAFVCWFLLAVAGAVVVMTTEQAGSTARGIGMIIATVLPWIALIGWPTVMTRIRGNGPIIDLGLRWKWSDIGWGVLWGGAGLVVAVALAVLTTAIFGDFDSAAGKLAESLAENKVIFVIFLLTVVIGAPIVEEFFFRGYVFNAFAKAGWLPMLSVLMSALIFAAWHMEPVRLLVLFGIGITLGLARWLTGSLTTSIVAHMTNNLISSITLLGLLFS